MTRFVKGGIDVEWVCSSCAIAGLEKKAGKILTTDPQYILKISETGRSRLTSPLKLERSRATCNRIPKLIQASSVDCCRSVGEAAMILLSLPLSPRPRCKGPCPCQVGHFLRCGCQRALGGVTNDVRRAAAVKVGKAYEGIQVQVMHSCSHMHGLTGHTALRRTLVGA